MWIVRDIRLDSTDLQPFAAQYSRIKRENRRYEWYEHIPVQVKVAA
jgi:hypothetical protein